MNNKIIYHSDDLRAKVCKGKIWANTLNIKIQYRKKLFFFYVWVTWDNSINIQFMGNSPSGYDDSWPHINTSGNGFGDKLERYYIDKFNIKEVIKKLFDQYLEAEKRYLENGMAINKMFE